jgi:hypothetical protein
MCSAFASARAVHARDQTWGTLSPMWRRFPVLIRAPLAARLAGPSKPRQGTQQPLLRNQNARARGLRARYVPILTFFLISPVGSSLPSVTFFSCFARVDNAQIPLSHSASLPAAKNSLLAMRRNPSLPSDLLSFFARNVACAAPFNGIFPAKFAASRELAGRKASDELTVRSAGCITAKSTASAM